MFNLRLDAPSKAAGSVVPSEATLRDYASLVMEACEALRETDCHFHMGGFGQDDWKLDVAYDLSAVVEQLPDLLDALRTGLNVELDIYTQGIERIISFVPNGEFVTLQCRSSTSWHPDPSQYQLPTDEVILMFERLAIDFGKALARAYPGISRIMPFDNWCREIV